MGFPVNWIWLDGLCERVSLCVSVCVMDWFTFWFSQRIAWVHLNKDVPAAESTSVITSAMCFVLLILWAVKHLLGRSLNCLEILDGLLWNYLQTSEILKGWIPLNLGTPLNLYLASPQVLFRFINTLTCFSKLVIMVDIIPAALLYLITASPCRWCDCKLLLLPGGEWFMPRLFHFVAFSGL